MGKTNPSSSEPDPPGEPAVPEVGLDEQDYRASLDELLEGIGKLPTEQRRRLQVLVGETRQRHEKLRESVMRLQETLDTLRVSVKYLIFDVEATRRENDHLRKKISDQGD
jgi:hypothetical protein